ncbi:MAG: hypothetical protein Q8908_03580 [Bacteroidota bacterium]|nr:hypothetical protein [Bacteroidota bacterium]
MISNTGLFSLKNNYDSAIAGLIGALLVLLFTKHGGIGLEPDSIVYLSTARNIIHGGGFFEFEDIPMTDFPIGYPAFLSFVLFITNTDILQCAIFINMALYFCLIYISGGIINHIATKNRWIKIPFLFLIVFSPALLSLYTMLLSETLFLVMCLMFFMALHQYGKKKTILALAVVATIAGLSCIVRYAGVTLLGAGGLMILLDRRLQMRKKIGHLALFGAIGISFLTANLVRNYLITDQPMGDREKSLTSLFQNIQNYACVFSRFFHYQGFPMTFVILIAISFFIFHIYLHFIHSYKVSRCYNYWNICATYFIIYSLFIILSATFSRFETLDVRLLSPLFLPCLLPFSFVITWMISRQKGLKKYSLISLVVMLFGVIIFLQYRDDRKAYLIANESGIPGYAEDCWKDSPILNYIKNNPKRFKDNPRIYSDGNEAVYLFTGLKAEIVPHVESDSENSDFMEDQQNETYLVWFYENADPELVSLKTLLKKNKYKKLISSPEGCIYYHPAPTENQSLN